MAVQPVSISWTLSNWVTVILMVTVTFAVAGLLGISVTSLIPGRTSASSAVPQSGV